MPETLLGRLSTLGRTLDVALFNKHIIIISEQHKLKKVTKAQNIHWTL